MFIQASPISVVILIATATGLALLFSAAMSKFFVWRGFLPDLPNARSSHRRVTPRSGGVAIFIGWSIAVALLAFQADAIEARRTLIVICALAGGAMILGLADDRYSPTTALKFAGQLACASVFVLLAGPLELTPTPFIGAIDLGPWAVLLTIFWIVAFMNAFNFMDGANGIAALTAMVACAAFTLAAAALGALAESLLALTLMFAIAGFLRENFPHGRLFMGDGGSQCIGFALAALGVSAANATNGALSALFVPTLMMPFLFDVAFTLAHRAKHGERLWNAHREHLYQLLMREGASHVAVAAIYFALAAFSAMAAIWMLRLSPDWQWAAPALLGGAFIWPAFAIYRASELYDRSSQNEETTAEGADVAQLIHAAE